MLSIRKVMTSIYNINDYKNPLFTVDSVLFTVHNKALKVLLVKRAIEPFNSCWGLPGGFVDIDNDDNTDVTALRKLEEKTGVVPPYLEQLQTYSSAARDPRGYSVTLVYFALVAAQEVQAKIDGIDDVKWIDLTQLDSLSIAFDHKLIISKAKERLVQKTLYSMVPVYCLPERFTIGELKHVIEVIIGKSIQRKSLIRRIESSGMFEALEDKVKSGGRLAQQYTITKGADIINFERNFIV